MSQQTFEFKEENYFLGFTDPSSDMKLDIGGNKIQTALDWFFNQLSEKTQANNEKEYYQALQMEKEQMEAAWNNGYKSCKDDIVTDTMTTFENYIKSYE